MGNLPRAAGRDFGATCRGSAFSTPCSHASAFAARSPENVTVFAVRVPGKVEQQVGESVEILDCEKVHFGVIPIWWRAVLL